MIELVHRRRVELVPQPQVECESGTQSPVVLHKKVVRSGAQSLRVVVEPANGDRRETQQKIRQRVACERGLENKLPSRKHVVKAVYLESPDVRAVFQGMISPDPGHALEPLPGVVVAHDGKRNIVRQAVESRDDDGRHAEVDGIAGRSSDAEGAGQVLLDILLQDLAAEAVESETEFVQHRRAEAVGF